MRDTSHADFRLLVDAENEHTERWMAQHAELVDTIDGEIRSRVQETDEALPEPYGPWWYVSRTEEGSDYRIHLRGPTSDTAADRIVLDENVEAAGHEFFDLGGFEVSVDHEFLAWSADTTGNERQTLRIRDLETGNDLDRVDDIAAAGLAWAHDWVFYVRSDEQERPATVWRHRRGTTAELDELVWREDDTRFHVQIGLSRSESWIIIHSGSATSSEVLILRADDPEGVPTVAIPRRPDVEYTLDHWADRFVVVTNHEAEDFRILASPPGVEIGPATSWDEIEPHVPGRRIVSADAFRDFLLVYEWADAQPRLRVIDRAGRSHLLDTGPAPSDVEPGANPSWNPSTIRFRTTSLVEPVTDWDVAPDRRTPRRRLRQTPTPNVDLDAYVTERVTATSNDGTLVPLDVVRHRDTPLDGTAPGLLYGYGAYEASIPPWFSVARLSLLDRGWVWALAHPRGGGEFGRRWYLEGRLTAKPNTFADFAACGERLVADRFVAADRLAIRGASAGGLLVGACTVASPASYAATIAQVPFVDVVATMLDDTLPLTAVEREEWGDPRRADDCALIASYSPYDNTSVAAYPAMFVTAGLNDPRVGAHEPVKWVSRLRDVDTGGRPILLHTDTGAGHAGPSGRYAAWRDEARILAFLLTTV